MGNRAKRQLHWKRAHGLVEVTVQLVDRALTVWVTPIHLAVLACFNAGGADESGGTPAAAGSTPSGPRLSLQEVASSLSLPEALTRKRIGYWVSKGVLKEISAGVFEIQESLSTTDGAAVG